MCGGRRCQTTGSMRRISPTAQGSERCARILDSSPVVFAGQVKNVSMCDAPLLDSNFASRAEVLLCICELTLTARRHDGYVDIPDESGFGSIEGIVMAVRRHLQIAFVSEGAMSIRAHRASL